MLSIPISPLPDQSFKTALDGETVRIRLFWVANAGSWFMDIEGVSFDLDVSGLRVCTGVLLLGGLAIREIGDFFILDMEEKLADPDYDGLGGRYQLMYWTKEELGYDTV